MLQRQVLDIDLPEADSLPVLTILPEDRAMGHIPGWVLLMDPAHIDAPNNAVRNRAVRDNFMTGDNLAMSAVGGQPVFNPQTGDTIRLFSEGVAINPDAWSVFVVANPSPSTSRQQVVSATDAPDSEVILSAGFSTIATHASIFDVSGTRLDYDGGYDERTELSLVMWTSSTREGLRIFDNGVLVAANADDKRALTAGFGPGQWESFRFTRGQFGMIGMLNIDLGWPEHAGYRRAIEKFLTVSYTHLRRRRWA